jgi:hypothetical protein
MGVGSLGWGAGNGVVTRGATDAGAVTGGVTDAGAEERAVLVVEL